MRDMLFWGDAIEYEDPEPVLERSTVKTMESLLQFDVPKEISRALRWYRLGVNAIVPDDQYMNFWFALEIVAEFQKSPEKVPDTCTKCGSPLYCESCHTHTTHKPYARQAIRALLKQADPECDDETIRRLDDARNGLMHGSTLEEIEEAEERTGEEREHLVDVLGHLVWRAILRQFPPHLIQGQAFGYPTTYLHHTMGGIVHMQTVVPAGPHNDLDLDSAANGFKAEIKAFGPPQSATAWRIFLTPEQHERLTRLAYETNGEQRELCRRVFDTSKKVQGGAQAVILSTDMATIRSAVKRGDAGEWIDLFREFEAPPVSAATAPSPISPQR